MARFSIGRSISRTTDNMRYCENDGTVLEINSQGSRCSASEMTPEKKNQENADAEVELAQDDEPDLAFLSLTEKELANSFEVMKE